MPAYLLTWNPAKWGWDTLEELVSQHRQGQEVEFKWSTGNRKNLSVGDRVFLLRQAVPPIGIVASGVITQPPFEADHWDQDHIGPANYVLVRPDALIDPNKSPPLDLGTLSNPDRFAQLVRSQSGGVEIPSELAAAIERAWEDYHPMKYVDGTTQERLEGLAYRVAAHLPAREDEPQVPPVLENTTSPCSDDVCSAILVMPDIGSTVNAISSQGYFDKALVEDCLAQLSIGHIFLAGPPGTGKSRLARDLARACNAQLVEATANPEWSVYDLIGTVALTQSGAKPKDGVFTSAVKSCCTNVAKHLESGGGHQATWLLIDEINRAEIDRAFGPLFTALASTEPSSFALDHLETPSLLKVPARFRLIATLNSFDASFVNSMSAALRRRFGRVSLLPPPNENGNPPAREVQIALSEAARQSDGQFGDAGNSVNELGNAVQLITEFFGAVREGGQYGSVPLGTAHLIDVLLYATALRRAIPSIPDEELADRALASRLTSSLESDAMRVRTGRDFVEAHLAKRFPGFRRTLERLKAFQEALD
jgi:5-methylcytosine-specific restriction protein B